MERFKGKAVVVTGGAQGIGEAIVKRFADEGAAVAILDIQDEKAQVVANAVKSKGGKAFVVKMDITNSQDVKRAIKDAESKLGKIDILVNNVGSSRVIPFMEMPEEIWDQQIAINFRGPVTVTRAVLDGMVARKNGKIIFISSDAGRAGSSGEAVYAGTKGAIIAFAKTIAREMTRNNVLVNVVCPGPTDTPLLAQTYKDHPKLAEALEKAVPLKRLAKPEDIAGAVTFLASDDASYMTGQTMSVSGGLTMF